MQKFDFKKLAKLTNPQAIKDLDRFLDALPVTVGLNALIAAGITWVLAGGAVLFASTQSTKVAELRAQLLEVESLRPPVPVINFVPLQKSSIEEFVNKIETANIYPVLKFNVTGDGKLDIGGQDSDFTAMTYAVGHIQGGGRNWHVDVSEMCIGPECTGQSMNVKLDVSTIRIQDAPQQDEG